MDGKVLFAADNVKPTGETPLHTNIYRKRPDIKSLVHAHPPILTGFAIAHNDILAKAILPEPILELGPILSIRYEEPLSDKLANAIEEIICKTNAFLMENHGVMVLSVDSSERTLDLLEMLEAMAKSVLVAKQLGNIEFISDSELENLDNVAHIRNLQYPGKPGDFSSYVDLYE